MTDDSVHLYAHQNTHLTEALSLFTQLTFVQNTDNIHFITQASSDAASISPEMSYTPLPSGSRDLTNHRGKS